MKSENFHHISFIYSTSGLLDSAQRRYLYILKMMRKVGITEGQRSTIRLHWLVSCLANFFQVGFTFIVVLDKRACSFRLC